MGVSIRNDYVQFSKDVALQTPGLQATVFEGWCGSAVWSKAMVACGFLTEAYDALSGGSLEESQNLLCIEVLEARARQIIEGDFFAVWLSPPCSRFGQLAVLNGIQRTQQDPIGTLEDD